MSTVGYKWLYFLIWVLCCLGLFLRPLRDLGQLAWHDDTASHILLIPFISGWLLFSDRRIEHSREGLSFRPALIFVIPSILIAIFAFRCVSVSKHDRLSSYIFSLVLLIISGFVFSFGLANAKRSSFALAFLLFAVPIPELILDKLIYCLQVGSAAIAEVFFNLSSAPVLRDGFVFRLPNMSIEVAEECSGIRSSLALLILSLLVAHFSFHQIWKKTLFVVAGLAMMLIKNGIRIAALTLLANYVNPDFLYGKLHHQGGVVFFLIGLALLWPLYWYLRKGETRFNMNAKQVGSVPLS